MIFPCLTNVPVKNVPSPKSREGGHRRMREKGGREKRVSEFVSGKMREKRDFFLLLF